jgi:hypothetical protein
MHLRGSCGPCRACTVQVLVICHWFACLLGLLRLTGDTPLDTWQAKFGLCGPTEPPINNCMPRWGSHFRCTLSCAPAAAAGLRPVLCTRYERRDAHSPFDARAASTFALWRTSGTGERDYVCVPPSKMYLKTFSWAMGLITGSWGEPLPGPFGAHYSEGTEEIYNTYEDLCIVIIAIMSTAVWATVTGKIVDLIANHDPDTTHFKAKMDDLNRFCWFYGIKAAEARSHNGDVTLYTPPPSLHAFHPHLNLDLHSTRQL